MISKGKIALFALGGAVGAGIAWAIETLGAGSGGLLSGEMKGGRLPPVVQQGMYRVVQAGVAAWKDSFTGAEYFDNRAPEPEIIVIPPRSRS